MYIMILFGDGYCFFVFYEIGLFLVFLRIIGLGNVGSFGFKVVMFCW